MLELHNIIQILVFKILLFNINNRSCNYFYSDFNVLCHDKRYSLQFFLGRGTLIMFASGRFRCSYATDISADEFGSMIQSRLDRVIRTRSSF